MEPANESKKSLKVCNSLPAVQETALKSASSQVIGAGFGRTGTMSLKLALEKVRCS